MTQVDVATSQSANRTTHKTTKGHVLFGFLVMDLDLLASILNPTRVSPPFISAFKLQASRHNLR